MKHFVVTPNRIACDFDRMFNGFFNTPSHECSTDETATPRVNIEETPDHLSLTFELPGMEKDQIKVLVKDDVLTIAAERTLSGEDKDSDIHGADIHVRREIRNGKFSRSFTLPETVDPESVSADYKNGLLTVKLGKKEEVKPREIDIKIN